MIQWIVAHQAIVAGLLVAIFDFVMALVPSIEANGIFHQVYLWIKSIAQKPQIPPAAPPV